MADRVATIKGTFLVPTVSKNNRLYTAENIGKAVERMNVRLQSKKELPLTMFPSHGQAEADNALMTIGRVTRVSQEADGSATFEADIANTTAGRDMAALVTPDNPYIKGLSIRGQWMSTPKTVEMNGSEAVTADDLDVFGIDWTARPGVEGAQITQASLAESVGENAIFESAEAEFFFDETAEEESSNDDRLSEAVEQLHAVADLLAEAGDAPGNGKLPYGTDANYADPGYQKDKKKRYPLNTAKRVRAAWSYINVASNAAAYTSAQLARIKSKIKSAAKKYKINVAEELSVMATDFQDVLGATESSLTPEQIVPLAWTMACEAMFKMNTDEEFVADGPVAEEDPEETPEAVNNNDNNMSPTLPECAECGESMPVNALYCPTCGAMVTQEAAPEINDEPAESQGETALTEKEAPVADDTQTGATETTSTEPVVTQEAAPAVVTFSTEQFQALMAAMQPKEAAPPAPVEETKVTMTESEVAAMIAKAQEEARVKAETDAVEAIRAAGIIPRTGLVASEAYGMGGATRVVTESKIPTVKELSEMTNEEYIQDCYEALKTNPEWHRALYWQPAGGGPKF